MIAVLDPSAAVDLILNKGNGQNIRAALKESSTVIAPELYIPEISNVAWKYHKLAHFSKEAFHPSCLTNLWPDYISCESTPY